MSVAEASLPAFLLTRVNNAAGRGRITRVHTGDSRGLMNGIESHGARGFAFF